MAAAVALALGSLDARAQQAGPAAGTLPGGARVAAGQASISQSGSAMQIQQSSSRAALDWQSFSIGSGASVTFNQPSASAIALNRVLGPDASQIFGRLSANGQVFLLNPNGILFARGAQIDVGGLLASTLGMQVDDFMAGRYTLRGDGASGSIFNQGALRALPRGYVALIAPAVANEGTIETPRGTTALAGAGAATMSFLADGLVQVRVDEGALSAEIANRGAIRADGGAVLLTARARDSLGRAVVNTSGVIEARTVENISGVIRLSGGEVRLDTGSVTSASGAQGGSVTLDGGWVGVGGDVRADGAADGGRIDISSTGGYLLAATVSATGGSGAGGAIDVNVAGKSWENSHAKYDASGASGGSIRHVAGQQITTSGTYLANGSSGQGGRIDLSAPATKLLSAQLHADGASGGGQVRVGGEYQGGKHFAADELPNAELLAISAGSVITANATQNGPGGTVVAWANIDAAMYGDVSARPANGGAGGLIEISSGDRLTYGGTASAGLGGTVLFDPKNLVIGPATGGASQYSIVLGYNYVDVRRLKGNDLEAGDQFGYSVSLSGTQMAVGAPFDDGAGAPNAGAVYLFNNPFTAPALAGVIGKGYTGTGNLDVSALAAGDFFGYSISLTGTQLAVGAIVDAGAGNSTSGAGAVYLLNNPFSAPALTGVIGKGYTGTGNLDVSTLEGSDFFGSSVSLSGTQLAVGAQGDDGAGNGASNAGAVYLFNNPFTAPALAGIIGKDYTGPGNLDVSALAAGDFFGYSVSLSGTQLAVGAPFDAGATNSATNAGAVYLFSNPFTAPALAGIVGKGYTGPGNLDVSALEAGDQFGVSVSLSGIQLAVGAWGDDGAGNGTSDAGAVYLFNNPVTAPALAGVIGKGYTGTGNLDVSTLEGSDFFGSSVSLSGAQLAVGARGDDGAGNSTSDAGAVYLFNNPFTTPVLAGVIGRGYFGAGNYDVSALETDFFGWSVSLSGTQLAVGSPGDDGAFDSGNGDGAVYLINNPFTAPALSGILGKGYTGSGNLDVSTLQAGVGAQFGSAVSLSGTQLAVGASGQCDIAITVCGVGAVFLINNPFSATPTLAGTFGKGYTGPGNFDVTKLNGPGFTNMFGASVSLSGTQLAVGSPGDDGPAFATTDTGAVYLFNNPFSATPTLAGVMGKGYPGSFDVPALVANDQFGFSVSLSGTQLAVGAIGDDGFGNNVSAAGAVYLFNNPFTTPALAGIIGKDYTGGGNFNVSALEAGDTFGYSVSLFGTNLAVGANSDDGIANSTSNAGAVYVLSNPFGATALTGVMGKGYSGPGFLDVSSLESGDEFGFSVSMYGTDLAVGAVGDDGNANSLTFSGAVYGFNLAGGAGDPVASATFANNPGADSTITPAAITAITDTGSSVVLQANNDITLAAGSAIVSNNPSGAGGSITLQAGRSVILNDSITTDNGDLTITANDSGAQAANRDAGAGGITMAAGTTLNAGTGTVALTVSSGVPGNASGNLVVENITAANVNLQQTGRFPGNSILRASANSLITATNLLLEVDLNDAVAGGSVGTAAAPMRVTVTNLESHTHEASPGIFIDSPTQGVTIGDVPFFGGAVKGVQNVTSGDISITANGNLTTLAGTAGCGPTGGTGGPVCAGSSVTLVAANGDLSIGNVITHIGAGTGTLTARATNSILVSSGADITSGGGAFGITLNSDSDASGAGAIAIGDGVTATSILSNGGSILLGGGASAAGFARGDASNVAGIRINSATISSGAGSITLRGQGYGAGTTLNYGININQGAAGTSAVQSTTGAISVTGLGGGTTSSNYGVRLQGGPVSSVNGGISVAGTGGGGGTGSGNVGIFVFSSGLVETTGSGSITLVGQGGSGSGGSNEGVDITPYPGVSSVNGNISITGTAGGTGSFATGLNMNGTVQSTGTGSITMTGLGAGSTIGNSGIELSASGEVSSVSGNISLTGTGGNGTSDNNGITHFNNIIKSSSGNIAITGFGGGTTTANYGVLMQSSAKVETTGIGSITMTGTGGPGTSGNDGVRLTTLGTRVTTTGSGNISITGTGAGSSDNNFGFELDNGAIVEATGSGSISITGQGSAAATGNFNRGVRICCTLATKVRTTSGSLSIAGTGGGAGTNNDGLSFNTGEISASGAGNISLTGQAGPGTNSNLGIDISNTAISSAGGNILLDGDGAGSGGSNKGISWGFGTATTSGAGTITIAGRGAAVGATGNGKGIDFSGGSVASVNGAITISGTGGSGSNSNEGVNWGSTSITASGSGNISIAGVGGAGTGASEGVELFSTPTVASGSGNIVISGTGGVGTSSPGVLMNGSLQTGGSGTITVVGQGGAGPAGGAKGVNTSANITTAGGGITITGTGSGTSVQGYGVDLISGTIRSSGGGPVTITGTGSGSSISEGVRMVGGTLGDAASASTIIIRTASSPGLDAVDLAGGLIRGSGQLFLEPINPLDTIGLGGGVGTLNLSSAELGTLQDGFAQITIGHPSGTGLISVGSHTFNDPIIIRNTGGGSAGIVSSGTLAAGTNDLNLSSAGNVSVTQGTVSGANIGISAANLVVQPDAPAVSSALVNATGNLTVNASLVRVRGSDTSASLTAKLQAGGTIAITAGSLNIEGGNANNAGAAIDPTQIALTATGSVTLQGGTGSEAYALLLTQAGNVAATAGGTISLLAGTGLNANAAIVAGTGIVTMIAPACVGCASLALNPWTGSQLLQTGVFGAGGATFQAAAQAQVASAAEQPTGYDAAVHTATTGGGAVTPPGASYGDSAGRLVAPASLLSIPANPLMIPDFGALLEEMKAKRDRKRNALAKAVRLLEEDPTIADLPPCAGPAGGDCIAPRNDAETPGERALPAPKLAQLPAIERKVALLIGVADYSDPIPSLDSPVKDIEEIGRILRAQLGYEVRILANADKPAIVRELNRLILETGRSDSVTVMYAGHGHVVDRTQRGYWIPAKASADDPRQWISNTDIGKVLENIPARQVLLVSDSCYSGTLAREAKMERAEVLPDPAAVLERRSVTVLSSGGDEPVPDQGKDGHSVFAWHLMRQLRDIREVTLGVNLHEKVAERVQADIPQQPQYGAGLASGHQRGGDYLFEVRRYE